MSVFWAVEMYIRLAVVVGICKVIVCWIVSMDGFCLEGVCVIVEENRKEVGTCTDIFFCGLFLWVFVSLWLAFCLLPVIGISYDHGFSIVPYMYHLCIFVSYNIGCLCVSQSTTGLIFKDLKQ